VKLHRALASMGGSQPQPEYRIEKRPAAMEFQSSGKEMQKALLADYADVANRRAAQFRARTIPAGRL